MFAWPHLSSLRRIVGWPLPAVARGLVAYGSAEAVTRAVRLVAILIVARRVTPEMLGTAALALSLFELVRVLANVGIGQRLIAATDEELPALCEAARKLFWLVCGTVALIQLAVAAAVALVWQQGEAAAMLAVLALVYPCMPAGLVQIFLTMREGRLPATARIAATQTMADNALTVALVLAWPSAWAIVLPKLLTAPIWTLGARRAHSWRSDPAIASASWRAFAGFGPAILLSDVLGAARVNADKLVVGALLGTEALGLYYFAFNAGLGITQSFVTACNLVVFPHLARARIGERDGEFRRAFAFGLALLGPVVAAQIALAPIYVPLLFGSGWADAAPYVTILAGAALPLYAGSLLGARWRAAGRPFAETHMQAAALVASLGGLALGATYDLAAACTGFAAGLALVLLPLAIQPLLAGLALRTPNPISQGDLS